MTCFPPSAEETYLLKLMNVLLQHVFIFLLSASRHILSLLHDYAIHKQYITFYL
jgi:hypothetical protein